MTSRLDIGEIKALLVERLEGLVGELVPGAVARGDHFEARSPLRVDRHVGSFVVWRRGRAAGGWKDYASDEKGDVLDLIACVACGAGVPPTREQRIEAVKWAESWLGLAAALPPEDRARLREKAKRQASEAQQREEAERRRKRRRAFDIWTAGKDWRGTLVETYLRARGIELERIENWDDGLRFAPRLESWMEPHVGPAMLGAFRHPKFGFAALHATFLRPDGSGKADIDKQKLMLGSVSGGAIRLTRGPSGLRLEEAEAKILEGAIGVAGELGGGEGIETTLSCAAGFPEARWWAFGSLGNLGAQPASPAISSYLVAADNDWSKPGATAAFEKHIAALSRHGRPVAVARAFRGKDFNDLARV